MGLPAHQLSGNGDIVAGDGVQLVKDTGARWAFDDRNHRRRVAIPARRVGAPLDRDVPPMHVGLHDLRLDGNIAAAGKRPRIEGRLVAHATRIEYAIPLQRRATMRDVTAAGKQMIIERDKENAPAGAGASSDMTGNVG